VAIFEQVEQTLLAALPWPGIAYLTSWQCKPVSGLQFKASWRRFALGLFSYNPAGNNWFGFELQTLLTPCSSLSSLFKFQNDSSCYDFCSNFFQFSERCSDSQEGNRFL
jgi:hypothetical protein